MLVSAITCEWIARLTDAIEARIAQNRIALELVNTEVLSRTNRDNGTVAMRVRVDPGQGEIRRLKNAGGPSALGTAHRPTSHRSKLSRTLITMLVIRGK